MSKREKSVPNIQDQEQENPDQKTINLLIEKRKLQQEALKKIMNSIDKPDAEVNGTVSECSDKRGSRIKKIFSSAKNIK